MSPPPTFLPQDYQRPFRERRETCERAVIRDGDLELCDRPADYLAHDPEAGGEFPHTLGFYPACERHRMRGPAPLTLIARPELGSLGVASVVAGMAAMSA